MCYFNANGKDPFLEVFRLGQLFPQLRKPSFICKAVSEPWKVACKEIKPSSQTEQKYSRHFTEGGKKTKNNHFWTTAGKPAGCPEVTVRRVRNSWLQKLHFCLQEMVLAIGHVDNADKFLEQLIYFFHVFFNNTCRKDLGSFICCRGGESAATAGDSSNQARRQMQCHNINSDLFVKACNANTLEKGILHCDISSFLFRVPSFGRFHCEDC